MHRTLDLEEGRWRARDPLEYVSGDNLYRAFGDMPINSQDPLGTTSYSTAPIGSSATDISFDLDEAPCGVQFSNAHFHNETGGSTINGGSWKAIGFGFGVDQLQCNFVSHLEGCKGSCAAGKWCSQVSGYVHCSYRVVGGIFTYANEVDIGTTDPDDKFFHSTDCCCHNNGGTQDPQAVKCGESTTSLIPTMPHEVVKSSSGMWAGGSMSVSVKVIGPTREGFVNPSPQ